MSINPFLGLLKDFKITRENIEDFIENDKKSSFNTDIDYNILSKNTTSVIDYYSLYLNPQVSKIKNNLLYFFNNRELFLSCLFPSLYTETEIRNNFYTLFFKQDIKNFFCIDSNFLIKTMPISFVLDNNFILNLYDSLSKLSNKEKIDLLDYSSINSTLFYNTHLYVKNSNWMQLLDQFKFNQNSDDFFDFEDNVENLFEDLLKSNKRKDPMFLSYINSMINKINISKDSKEFYQKKIKKSKYWKDDANLLLYTINLDQYNENIIKLKELIKDDKLEIKNIASFKDFIKNIDLDKEIVKTSDLVNALIKMI